MIERSRLQENQWDELAELTLASLSQWYSENLNRPEITAPAAVMRVFPEVYEALDTGCCITAVCSESGKLAGACFYHPRETHVSLGIMVVHPDFGGRGIAKDILADIIHIAKEANLPIRLVSSAMNLDSFSLYTRAGFVPQQLFQDLCLAVPENGLTLPKPQLLDRVRPAKFEDAKAMADLEFRLVGIRRQRDFEYFIENEADIWHVSVIESDDGSINGFLCSVNHPGSNMLGPGVICNESSAAALIYAELDAAHRGKSPVFLVPTDATELVQTAYSWGARNRELHVSQVLGEASPAKGIVMPTFMPETG